MIPYRYDYRYAPQQRPCLAAPCDPLLVTALFTATGGAAYGVRIMAPRSGNLRDISAFISTQAGNLDVGVYDTTVTTRNRLYSSGSFSCPAASTNAVILADPNLAVIQGEQYDLVIATSGAAVLGALGGNQFNMSLPANFLPSSGAGNRKLIWTATQAIPLPATWAESSLGDAKQVPFLFARIS